MYIYIYICIYIYIIVSGGCHVHVGDVAARPRAERLGYGCAGRAREGSMCERQRLNQLGVTVTSPSRSKHWDGHVLSSSNLSPRPFTWAEQFTVTV